MSMIGSHASDRRCTKYSAGFPLSYTGKGNPRIRGQVAAIIVLIASVLFPLSGCHKQESGIGSMNSPGFVWQEKYGSFQKQDLSSVKTMIRRKSAGYSTGLPRKALRTKYIPRNGIKSLESSMTAEFSVQ